ncbi:MAG: hypothetical protein HYY24_08010 [Verrucomicrobia bacterium]|nr:hypothetical protein [Verrucomicrobiota bacterium]
MNKHSIALTALALVASVSTAFAQTLLLKDDFAGGLSADWRKGTLGQLSVIDEQLVVSGNFGPAQTNNPTATHAAGIRSIPTSGPLPDNQTLELRADLVGANQNDALAGLHFLWMPQGQGYLFFKDGDEVAFLKFWNGATSFAWFFYENRPLKNQNVTLVLALTRVGSDVRINTRVLDKDNANAVLFDRTVTDTPQADPVLPNRAAKGVIGMADLSGTPWPVAKAPTDVELTLTWANPESAPQGAAEVTFDNLEVWQYEPPELKIEPAVIVSWPIAPGNWLLESSATVGGRYVPLPQTPEIQDGRFQVVVPAANQAQFFRLHQLTAWVEAVHQGQTLGGAPFRGANGITKDAAGRLYIASAFGGEIVILNAPDGVFLERLGPAQGVLFPDDVVFGPDGSLYWTDLVFGQVGRRAPDGTVTKQFVALGVNPITFSADGRLFTGLAFLGDALWELDPKLQEPPKLILDAPGQLNSFSFGPDGQLYSPSNTRRSLVRIDVDAKTLTPVGALNRSIAAVKFDAAQRLWLLSEGDLLRVNRETGEIEQTIALGRAHLDNFVPVANDRFYVTVNDGELLEVSQDGTIRQVRPGGMVNPGGLAVVRDGDKEVVVAADLESMHEFDAVTGALRKTHQSNFIPPPGVSTLLGPMTVSASPAGVVLSGWVFPSAGYNVQEYDPATGSVLRQVIVTNTPINAIEFQGKLVVAEVASGSVAQFAGGERTVLASGLFVPAGLAASADALFVGDWASGLIFQLVAAGAPLIPPRIITAGLKFPEGLALDANGNLLVVETGSRSLVRVNTATGQISTVAAGLALGPPGPQGFPPTYMFDGVAVAPSGAIYVTGYGANVIDKITE